MWVHGSSQEGNFKIVVVIKKINSYFVTSDLDDSPNAKNTTTKMGAAS